jgi:SAM-dependent methyltransferase
MILSDRSKWIYEQLPGAGRLLDVGCFDAKDTAHWSDRVDQVFGIDSHEAVLSGSKIVTLAQASADNLPFRHAAFDVVTFAEVLEHLPSELERRALEEIRRVLRADGMLLLTTPHRGLFAWLDPMDVKRRLGIRPGKGHKHYSVVEIEDLLNGLFVIEKLHLSSLILHPLSTWAGIGNRKRWLRVRSFLSDWDYRHSFGRASFNLAIIARPI